MPAAERKRPWYLVVALLGALAMGTTGSCSGWNTVALYREPIDTSIAGDGIANEEDRAAVVSRTEGYVRALDNAKTRGWPLGVAALVLGSALVFFSLRAMGGSSGARGVLVQLVVAQAAVNAAGYWLLRDVFEADVRRIEARQAADIHERIPDKSRADEMSRVTLGMLRAANPVGLVLHSLGSALIVVALTRRRSRDFLDSATAAFEER